MERIRWSRRPLIFVGGICLASALLIALGLLVVRGIAAFVLVGLGLAGIAFVLWGLRQMRRVDPAGWTITWDVPEPLQLAGYIGRHEGFSFAPDAAPGSPEEQVWRAWWQLLPRQIWAQQSALDDLLHAETSVGPSALIQSLGGARIAGSDPPAFESLGHLPALQALGHRHWPAFAAEWAAAKPAVISGMGRQGAAVREERVVRAAARAAGKAEIAPFLLRIDFVRWPADYQELRADGHVLLGVDYLQPAATERLRAVIAAAAAKLV